MGESSVRDSSSSRAAGIVRRFDALLDRPATLPVLLALLALVLIAPFFSDAQAARFAQAASVTFSGTLVLVTAAYVVLTARMVSTMREQLALEYQPNLVLACDEYTMPLVDLRLINLGRHPLWVLRASTTAPGGSLGILRPGPGAAPRQQHCLMPGESVAVTVFPSVVADERDEHGNNWRLAFNPADQAVLRVSFNYGPTGQAEHRRAWRVEQLDEPPMAARITPIKEAD